MSERIQKVLATLGVASRRAIEEWIAEGRILVNGRPATVGQKIDHNDRVRVDGRAIALSRKSEPTRVLLYKKRVGEVVTRDDPDGRRTVFRKLPVLEGGRWIAVGRLDINTSGLLLLTNDGELARRLMHPSFEIPRTYAVRVLGEVDEAMRERLVRGVELEDGPARFESMVRVDPPEAEEESANRWFEVTLREGRNREVRRLFESQRLQVSRLMRTSYGPIQLGRGIRSGSYRESTPEELHALKTCVGLADAPPKPAGRPASSRSGASERSRSGTRRPGSRTSGR